MLKLITGYYSLSVKCANCTNQRGYTGFDRIDCFNDVRCDGNWELMNSEVPLCKECSKKLSFDEKQKIYHSNCK